MAAAAASMPTGQRIDPATRETLLGLMTGVRVQNPDYRDTITVCVCGGLYALTAIMLVYAWCNYRYRPIRAKNLPWTTLIYISTVLWYIGNIPGNGHVQLVGVWGHCKVWILWFRVFFCFVFASMTIARFYALDRVFNQKKPFTAWNGLIAFAVVVAVNAVYCLVNQLISDSLTIEYAKPLEACNVTQALRIAAVSFQWVQWTACGYLIFRLRNIQSSFNEFYESIAIFVAIIALLTETTVTNLHYEYFVLEMPRRIEKTVMDTAVSNLVIWLMIAYPVAMSIFNRRAYEVAWMERLERDSNRDAVPEEESRSVFSPLEYGKSSSSYPATHGIPLANINHVALGASFVRDDALANERASMHYALLNSPLLFDPDIAGTPLGTRRVL